MKKLGEGWQKAGGMRSWDKQDNIKHRGWEESINCSIATNKNLWLINAVFLDSEEKQAETWLAVRNLRSWSHALTCSGSAFAGAVAGAGPLLHRMVNDGHKKPRGRGRGKAEEREEEERLKSFQLVWCCFSVLIPFNGFFYTHSNSLNSLNPIGWALIEKE